MKTEDLFRQYKAYLPVIALMLILIDAYCFVPPQEKKVKLLVVIDNTDPLAVDYRTTGNTVRQLLMLGGLLDIGISAARESSHSKKLRETVGEFDRFTIAKAAAQGAFSVQGKYFETTVSNDPNLLKNKTRVDFDKIPSGYPFVLVLNELFAGQVSAWKLGSLSAGSTLQYELYDVAEKKSFAKGTISGWSAVIHDFDEGVSNRSAFIVEYATAIGNAVGTIYGQLNKEGHLNTMAKSAGLGEFVPALDVILKKYAKGFDFEIDVPKGWSEIETGSKYSKALAPKSKDKALFGVRFDVDLLIRELGQDGEDLESYISLFVDKVSKLGYTVDNVMKPDLKFSEKSIPVVFNRPNNGGKEIVLFNRYSKEHIGIFSVILLQDPEGFINKYKPVIESTMASLSFEIHDK